MRGAETNDGDPSWRSVKCREPLDLIDQQEG
jgi:hypothetical protein